MAKPHDEEPDLLLVSTWLDSKGLTASRFSLAETQAGKTPDFRVSKGADHVAYCETKSPQEDDWLDQQLAAAPPGKIVGGEVPFNMHTRIARLLDKAAQQFAAVNPNRDKLNILAYVNHDGLADCDDLNEVLLGYWSDKEGERYGSEPLPPANDRIVRMKKWEIDVYLWFERRTGKLDGMVFNQNNSARLDAVCKLLGVDKSKIR